MKRLIKMPLRLAWRLTLPVRRPLVRRIEVLIARSTAQAHVHPHIVCEVSAETGVLMDHMIRELIRLQIQVETLSRAIEQITPSTTGLAVVSELDGDEPMTRSVAG
jgi:hypothetical protein